jgi:hypothetical protein
MGGQASSSVRVTNSREPVSFRLPSLCSNLPLGVGHDQLDNLFDSDASALWSHQVSSNSS